MVKYNNIIKILICLIVFSFSFQDIAKGENLYTTGLEENIKTPQIKKEKICEKIHTYQIAQYKELSKNPKYFVELCRKDSNVIKVTITADQLFMQNDTVLKNDADKLLKSFKNYLRNPGFYKILLVMHTDNTGSEDYCYKMSCGRLNAVYDWFAKGDVTYVVPYSKGCEQPAYDNNSREKRRLNRRLEIYIVPCDGMIEQAKRGTIDIKQPVRK